MADVVKRPLKTQKDGDIFMSNSMALKVDSVRSYSLKLVKEREVKYPVARVGNDSDSAQIFNSYIGAKDCEHIAVILLSASNSVVGVTTVAIGNRVGVNCDLRDIFKAAMIGNATAIILGHNHPSGLAKPSVQDVAFTGQVMTLSKLIGIPLLDHVIVTPMGEWFSFFKEGLITF